jgi:hypothetical protein
MRRISSENLPGFDVHTVRLLISMSAVLERTGFEATASSGDQMRGPSSIHGSSSPAARIFPVHLSRHIYPCFECGSKGNQLDLWAVSTTTGLYCAAIDLCERCGREIPWVRAR